MLEQIDVDRIGAVVGAPVHFEQLKVRPGRRATWRAHGSSMTAIVKAYASERACVVADRLRALAAGPAEPSVPSVLDVDNRCRVLVLSDVEGRPLREAVVARDTEACRRAGAALGRWHSAWSGIKPAPLRPHRVERELANLRSRVASASPAVAGRVESLLAGLGADWSTTTVVHRDLYEEQVLVGDRVGLIDLDDAALGPAELDVGNLVGHLDLLGCRRTLILEPQLAAILNGYRTFGPRLDDELVARCRTLTLLRLACLNNDSTLIDVAIQAPAL